MENFHVFVNTLFLEDFSTMSNIRDIFVAISNKKHWHYLNYSPIEEIYKRFGEKDPELKGDITSYKSDLAGFKATVKIVDMIYQS